MRLNRRQGGRVDSTLSHPGDIVKPIYKEVLHADRADLRKLGGAHRRRLAAVGEAGLAEWWRRGGRVDHGLRSGWMSGYMGAGLLRFLPLSTASRLSRSRYSGYRSATSSGIVQIATSVPSPSA